MGKDHKNMVEDQDCVRFFRPCDALRPYVRYFYVLKVNGSLRVLTFPLGCPQMIFHKRAPLYIPELDVRQSKFTVSGQVNFPAHVCSEGGTEMIVAVFYPHTAGLFTDVPMSLLYNREISGHDLENRALDGLAARISECGDNRHCVRMIEKWMIAKLRHMQAGNIGRIGAAVRKVLEVPSASVGELASTAYLGRKQFGRVFGDMVGMMPKEYARVVRFQRALWLMQMGERDGAGLAYGAGYADQSHLIREFRMFSGYTPRQLTEVCEPYSDLFCCPV